MGNHAWVKHLSEKDGQKWRELSPPSFTTFLRILGHPPPDARTLLRPFPIRSPQPRSAGHVTQFCRKPGRKGYYRRCQVALLRVRVSSSSYFMHSTRTSKMGAYEYIRLNQILLSVLPDDVTRRKIRLIEGNAKCRHLKKWTCKGTCGRCCDFCLRPRTPYPPSPLTYCIRVYSILIHTEKGWEGGELSREKVRVAALHMQSWGSKIPTWLTVSAVCKLW